MLVRAIYLDVAPYMRGRISPQKNYAAGVAPGDVMLGGAIGEVVRSNNSAYKAGEYVVSDLNFGLQDYAVLSPSVVRRIDTGLAPLPCWLDFMGLNGLTAYIGLVDAGEMRPGDTVLISAAAGSVGQIAGQIAKLAGCRTIAVTSSEEKIARAFGAASIMSSRVTTSATSNPNPAAVARECPDGVDVFFDNTAGPIHDAVLQNLATHARIILCGTVALAETFGQPDIGPRFMRQMLVARARIQGFLVLDYQHRYVEARTRLADWHRAGKLQYQYDIANGLENTPSAFLRVLTSKNLGKQLVRVGPEA